MWRIPSERIKLDLQGPTIEVERLRSGAIQFEAARLLGLFLSAKSLDAKFDALTQLYVYFTQEAQPTWDILDHRGALPNNEQGLARLPDELGLGIVSLWIQSKDQAQPEQPAKPKKPKPSIPGVHLAEPGVESAADALIAPGAGREEVKRRLKAVA